MANFLFLRALMSAARKCLLTLLGKQLTPVVERAVGNTQIARNLAHRLPADLYQLYRFNLKFPCIRSLCLLHDPFPFCVGFTLPSLLPSLLRVKTSALPPASLNTKTGRRALGFATWKYCCMVRDGLWKW